MLAIIAKNLVKEDYGKRYGVITLGSSIISLFIETGILHIYGVTLPMEYRLQVHRNHSHNVGHHNACNYKGS